MKIIYSFGKTGFEADYWKKEIESASSKEMQFILFNHSGYLDPNSMVRAQLLDNLYYDNNVDLQRLYLDIQKTIIAEKVDVLLVDNYCPYHPDFLKTLDIYKVLRINDGPMSSYDRDFAFLHAFDHILYHSPAYSRDMDMSEKLRYCGAEKIDFWPLGSFDALCNPAKTENDIISMVRDIDIVFVGALHLNKMPLLAAVKKAFGKRMKFYGVANLKKNVYFNLMYGFPGWVTQLPFDRYVPLYQRAKIGINVHNRGDYTVGGYRLFDLPANGVMQISDGGKYLDNFFDVGREIELYKDVDELIDKVRYFLEHDEEREKIAVNGFRRVQKDYKISYLLQQAGRIIEIGMSK